MLSRVLPVLAFVLSLVIVAFGAGVMVAEFKLPPYRSIYYGAKTAIWTWRNWNEPPFIGTFIGTMDGVAPDAAADRRLETTEAGAARPGTILVTGGLNQFRDICPENGCLAVEMGRDGTIVDSVPFRPDEILAADITDGSYYREAVPPEAYRVFRPVGLQRAENGDLIVSFLATGPMFPYGAGLARVDPDGYPRWYRFDYSHHWVTYEDGRIYVPDLTIADGNLDVPIGPINRNLEQYCETGRPMIDGIQILDGDGAVVQRLDMLEMFRASSGAAMLMDTFDACDPLHVNFVDVLDETAPGGDISPGFLLVSMRNINALAVVDPVAERITRVVRGTFQHQHAAQQRVGGKTLLFDNLGGSGPQSGSRVMEIDLVTGGERQIFPPPGDPLPGFFSFREGHLQIASDRRHVMITSTNNGAVEITLDDPERNPLLRFDSLHDLSGVADATDEEKSTAVRAKLFGIYYDDQDGQ